MEIKETLDTVVFGTCIVKKQKVAFPDGSGDMEWNAAYSLIDGSYIGDCTTAEYFEKKGVMPEARPGSSVASIGFCKAEQKWYGWSHRAVCGFGVGSKVKKGDCAYKPADPQDLLDDMIRFWVEDEDEIVTKTEILEQKLDAKDPNGQHAGLGVLLRTRKTRKKDKEVLESRHWEPYPNQWGRGEWEAKTLEDAKEMAVAFAEDVS